MTVMFHDESLNDRVGTAAMRNPSDLACIQAERGEPRCIRQVHGPRTSRSLG